MPIYPLILCGGSGTRLWPLSRDFYPKQLLTLDGSLSLLQNTVARLQGLTTELPIFICNENHRFLVAEQLRQIGQSHRGVLLEPVGRNTAPAVAVAALHAINANKNAILLVLPADHVIRNVLEFQLVTTQAVKLAEQGKLVTFGIVPDSAETGYGYIRKGESLDNGYAVAEFVEKPNVVTAERYLASGEYLWNSGMFVFKAQTYLDELRKFRPEILTACEKALLGSTYDQDFCRLMSEAFHACPEDSIDYAVMEHTKDAVVIPLDADWSDVGSFEALWDIGDKDAEGNVLQGDVLLTSTTNSLVYAQSRLVATLGVDNLVVVETEDAVLVAHKDSVQDIKAIVGELKKQKRSEWQQPFRVYRPWGYYESVDQGERHQVKRIGVQPGGTLSLQMHYHRAEHWIVVKGTAEVTCEDKVFIVSENQSTYIPLGHRHRLSNPGKTWLEIVEVQSGGYLGEDDIVRFEDNYGRT